MTGGERVAGIVLAAGASTRMPGSSKLVRPFGASTVVAQVAETALAAGLAPVAVVTGHEGDRVASCLEGLDVVLVENPRCRLGLTTSLQAGLRAVGGPPEAQAAVVLLGDEPGVNRSAILSVLRAWRSSRRPLVRTRYRDRPGHPVLVDRAVFSAALGLPAGEDVWSRLSSTFDIEEVPISDEAPVDVDRPEDLAAARARRT